MLLRALEQAESAGGEIEAVRMDVSRHVRSFESGEIAASVCVSIRPALNARAGERSVYKQRHPGEIVDLIAIRNDALDRRRDALRHPGAAWDAALAYIADEPEDASRCSRRRMGADRDARSPTAAEPAGSARQRQLLTSEAFRLETIRVRRFMVDRGLIAHPLDPPSTPSSRRPGEMGGRWIVHVPWLAAVVVVLALVSVQGLVLQPRQVESAREAAADSLRGQLTRDIVFIQSQVLLGAVEAIRDFVSASAAVPGLERMTLVDPRGIVLASSDIALEGQSIEQAGQAELAGLTGQLNASFRRRDRTRPLCGPGRHRGQHILQRRGALPPRPALRHSTPALHPGTRRAPGGGLLAKLHARLLHTCPAPGHPDPVVRLTARITRRLQHLATTWSASGTARRRPFRRSAADDIGRVSSLLRESVRRLVGARRWPSASSLRWIHLARASGSGAEGNAIYANAQYFTMFEDEPTEASTRHARDDQPGSPR